MPQRERLSNHLENATCKSHDQNSEDVGLKRSLWFGYMSNINASVKSSGDGVLYHDLLCHPVL